MYGDNCINKTNFKKGKKEIDIMNEKIKIRGWAVLKKEENFKIKEEIGCDLFRIAFLGDKT